MPIAAPRSVTSRETVPDDTVVIRLAVAADTPAITRLAMLDGQRMPHGTVLVAESDGELRAAYSLEEDRAVADPFHPTAGHVALLRTRGSLLRGDRPSATPRRRGLRRLLPAGG
jgi:hypothetical protein